MNHIENDNTIFYRVSFSFFSTIPKLRKKNSARNFVKGPHCDRALDVNPKKKKKKGPRWIGIFEGIGVSTTMGWCGKFGVLGTMS